MAQDKTVAEKSEKIVNDKAADALRENRSKALDLALAQIEKQFGKGSIMRMDSNLVEDIPVIPTGSLTLDIALGVWGIPRGRVIEIYGPESSGKTTLTLSVIKQLQHSGGVAAFIDAEHAFDANYAKTLGVKLDDLLVSQPDTGEQALEIAETLVRSNAVDLVVIDSVAALTPRAEIEGEMGDAHMGLQARLMSQALRKLTAAISKSKCCVIFINQIRMKIGVMFGNPETTTGGRALKFYASVRIDLRKIESIKHFDLGVIVFDAIEKRREILLQNIFGVDLNEESVEITKLSLFLKVCKKGLKLPNLDNNIKCGNSLIDYPEYAGDKAF